jgi:transcriptional regulator with XRE-family HTH domain
MPQKVTRRRAPRLRRPRYPDLWTYLAESGDTQANIARHVRVSQAHVSRIMNGATIPRGMLAARLAAYCQIPLDSFTRAYLAKRGARVA